MDMVWNNILLICERIIIINDDLEYIWIVLDVFVLNLFVLIVIRFNLVVFDVFIFDFVVLDVFLLNE